MDEATDWLDRPDPKAGECIYDPDWAAYWWAKAAQWDIDDQLAKEDREAEEAHWLGLHVSSGIDSVIDLVDIKRRQREDAADMWRVLNGLGCVVYIEHGSLKIEPSSRVPPALYSEAMTDPMREHLEGFCDDRRAV